MSFTISQKVTKSTQYGSLGVITDTGQTEVDVTYTVAAISSMNGTIATAMFDVSIGGVTTNKRYGFSFAYDSTSNPMDKAEAALQTYLSQ